VAAIGQLECRIASVFAVILQSGRITNLKANRSLTIAVKVWVTISVTCGLQSDKKKTAE
jgi:hypothetical protein